MIGMNEKQKEEIMRREFDKQAFAILEKLEGWDSGQDIPTVGLELEFVLKNCTGYAGEAQKSKVIEELNTIEPDIAGVELGAHSIEVRTAPVMPAELSDEIYRVETLAKRCCKDRDLSLVRTGIISDIDPKDTPITPLEKYKIVPAWHDNRRDKRRSTVIGGVDFATAKSTGLMNALHINVSARTAQDGVDKLNHSLALSPLITAVSGNARVVNNKDTGWKDIRLKAWEVTHDTREISDTESVLRLGLPQDYFSSIEEVVEHTGSFPFILHVPEAALPISFGIHWRDARLKFIGKKPIVELRTPSIQPSGQEDCAVALLYLGLLMFDQQHASPLPDMSLVKQSKEAAMKYGLQGICSLYKNETFHDALTRRIEDAYAGLRLAGIDKTQAADFLSPIEERLKTGKVPADYL